MTKLGKAARNERRKLHATFLNNLAVATIVTAMVAPCYYVMQHGTLRDVPVSLETLLSRDVFWSIVATLTGVLFAAVLRMSALSYIDAIED